MQSCSTIVSGLILGFVFVWKIGLVAMGERSQHCKVAKSQLSVPACMPVVVSTGYIRLVRYYAVIT
jgi:ATP-binding cassette subfamily B (MDR/TAP) protein 1